MKTAVILLAGGIGTRMQAQEPKQYLKIQQKPIVLYSYEVFLALPSVEEIIVVCDPAYRQLFKDEKKTHFALPGILRQESMYNGLQAISSSAELVCIHDAARPFITPKLVENVIAAAEECGAATAAMPIKYTVKESNAQAFVQKTLNRDLLWEIQTPQVIKKDLLYVGWQEAQKKNYIITDDVGFIELIGAPVKLVEGSSKNMKITIPEDLIFAEYMVKTARV